MAFQSSLDAFHDAMKRSAWAQELSGILPLSFLIDFIETPPKLHTLQLVGSVPCWSWVITPSAGRLLLSQEGDRDDCCQDAFGTTRALEVLDGRYGDRYFASSPETFRLVFGAHKPCWIENDHANMLDSSFEKRPQDIEVVYISPAASDKAESNMSSLRSSWQYALLGRWREAAPRYIAASFLGWALFTCLFAASIVLRLWISLAFYGLVFVTGMTIWFLYGLQTRQLRERADNPYWRLLVVTEHMNSSRWTVIIGKSIVTNSLMNRPLKRQGPVLPRSGRVLLYRILRACILGQWVTAIAAATTKDWNAYTICFWQCFTIAFHAFIITPRRGSDDWVTRTAGLKIRRFKTQVSSRRALLNTVVALNPDTFLPKGVPPPGEGNGTESQPVLSKGGMSWINPILASSADRTKWEEATAKAMVEHRSSLRESEAEATGTDESSPTPVSFPSPAWENDYDKNYWAKFILEGIHVAAKISQVASQEDGSV